MVTVIDRIVDIVLAHPKIAALLARLERIEALLQDREKIS